MVVAAVSLFSCDTPVTPDDHETEEKKEFAVEVKNVGPDFVEILVTAPSEVEIAYVLDKEPLALSPAVLFATGKTTTVSSGDVVKVTRNLTQNTLYYLYAVAKLDVKNYSKVVSVEFTTSGYEFTDFITVVDTYYDGYKVHITVPEDTKERGHAIRASSMPLALYNLRVYSEGQAAFDLKMMGSMGDPYSGHFFNDTTIVCGSTANLEYDENGNPVIDEDDLAFQTGEPIAPGEPTIFYAGECRYGTKEEFSQVMGYYQPERDSWSIPYFDRSTWTWLGAFEKKEFFTKQPVLCDCTVNVEIPEDEISVNDAMIYFDADEDVTRYFYMVLDDPTYNQILAIYLDGHEEWYQWFLTSYIAFYEWGIYPETCDTFVNAAANFVEPLVGGEQYHVLVTVMGDELGATQSFIHKTFTTKEKTKLPPVIEIKAVNTYDPYLASFNIKAPNKDIVGSYWACNYAREFEVMFNAKYTYPDILKGNSDKRVVLTNVYFNHLDLSASKFFKLHSSWESDKPCRLSCRLVFGVDDHIDTKVFGHKIHLLKISRISYTGNSMLSTQLLCDHTAKKVQFITLRHRYDHVTPRHSRLLLSSYRSTVSCNTKHVVFVYDRRYGISAFVYYGHVVPFLAYSFNKRTSNRAAAYNNDLHKFSSDRSVSQMSHCFISSQLRHSHSICYPAAIAAG
jgi:hypothetical protein